MRVYKAQVSVFDPPYSRTVYVEADCFSDAEQKIYIEFGDDVNVYSLQLLEKDVQIISHAHIVALKPIVVRTFSERTP